MAFVDPNHMHFQSQILQDNTHVPIDTGGGSISATDGTNTVNPLTSLVLPKGTLTDLGSGVGGVGLVFQRIGPFPFAWDTTLDLDGSWATLTELAADVLVYRAWAVFDEGFLWDNAEAGSVQIGITLLNGGSHNHSLDLVLYATLTAQGDPSHPPFIQPEWEAEPISAIASPAMGALGPIVTMKTSAILAAYPTQLPLTAGSCRVYAIIATPAA